MSSKIGLNKAKPLHKRNRTINLEGNSLAIFSTNAGVNNLKEGMSIDQIDQKIF
jgi:hypothetical protein